MAAGRGNTKDYAREKDDKKLWELSGNELETCWRVAVARDPLKSTYYKCKDSLTSTLGGQEVLKALEFMFEATSDEAFRTAALVMKAYQLDKGSIKTQTLNVIDGDHGARSLWYAMNSVHGWLEQLERLGRRKSVLKASQLAAVQLGIPGQSLRAVAQILRTNYAGWLQAVNDKKPPAPFPDGGTGRKLRVRLIVKHGQPTNLLGVDFDQDGFGVVPDNRQWREWIHRGYAALYGVFADVVKKLGTKKQDAP